MFSSINTSIKKIQFLKGPSSVVLCLLIITFLFGLKSLAEDQGKSSDKNLKSLIQNGGYIISKDGKLILAHNPETKFIPASTWKVVTALAVLENLTKNFRFSTEFYSDNQNNLYIKGFGDPFLISEEVAIILNKIRGHHVYEINDIYLDDSAFDVSTPPAGAANSFNPYDVINGALSVNFNTINFVVSPDGKIQSAEDQTPTLPIMSELGGNFSVGTHRINISQDPVNVLRYVGELFRALQERYNIPGLGKITPKKVPTDLEPFYTHHSSNALTDVIEALMLYSNNYIANQLYLTMGALDFGYPATWEKAKLSLQNYVSNTFPEYKKEIIVDEGSGLSHDNLITPRALLTALEKFKPYAHLLPLDKGRRIKSGTLKDVYSYAGYFRNNGKYDSFVIILNQPRNVRDKALDLLEQIYRQIP